MPIIVANLRGVEEARQLLEPRQFKDAMRRAKNRTAQTLKTRISSRLRDTLNIKKKDIDPYIKIKRASYSREDASVTVSRKAVPLLNYSPRQTAAGVVVKVYKGESAQLLRSTFKLTTGNSPVYERELRSGTGGTKKRAARFPLVQRFGPTAVGVLAGRPGILEAVVAEGAAILDKNVLSQTDFILQRKKFAE